MTGFFIYREVFHGDWHKNYIEEKLDTLVQSTHALVGSSGWRYFDEERPLSEVPSYVPHSTIQATSLYRISFRNEESPWSIFIQSGFFLTLHLYYENREFFSVESRGVESWNFIDAQRQERTVKYYLILYEEQRSIRLKNNWRAGLAYQVGVTRSFGKHFFAEGRLDAGIHFGPPPYESPEPPAMVRRLPLKTSLIVGWAF